MTAVMNRRDLEFLLFEWLDVTALTEHEYFAEHSRETFAALLELSEDLATTYFAPSNRLGDTEEPRIADDGTVTLPAETGAALAAFAKADLLAAQFDGSVGGMQLPLTVFQACMAWFQAANTATTGYAFLTIAAANLLVAHGSPEQVDAWVRPMLAGETFGTMCLSEPEAGSSLADVTTRATRCPDGTYRVVGTKMWISAGDHGLGDIVHLVLARTPGAPAGVRGLSLLAVPKYLPDRRRNDVVLTSLNHKTGTRGTTNAVLAFGDGTHAPTPEPGAVGYLVGEEGRGLAQMFHMMNEARIGVGLVAAAVGQAGYRKSLEYAAVRTQGRSLTDRDPTSPPVPLTAHPDVRRMLLAQKAYVEGGLALVLRCAMLVDRLRTVTDDRQRRRLGLLLDLLTPIAKSWPSQWCLEANSLAIQVHGGYGYSREFDVEQHWRDNRLNPIHEGTHGIQALDLLGRKVVTDGAFAELAAAIRATVAEAARIDALAEYAEALDDALTHLSHVTFLVTEPEHATAGLANATLYLEAAGHIVVAWIWLELAIAAHGREGRFYDGKRAAAQYFFRHELPKVSAPLDLLASHDRTALDLDPRCL
ncbi:acyl-CoA dehydrogenase [Actinomycetospora termitidis]|uniref:Acyl-CoA dehydrogenase n=1 Tax=Actinomycetospora termitidis TaxID=3053470 RepID=A0ABT7M7M2_9PSEU|nr:acyl-CoA dehydrogenase [Actinomycetospora sp. Odt1-22]MDL5156194.1 acyl-CoA dehydrogenase [Actinomycetospora sp. Odt1-22]